MNKKEKLYQAISLHGEKLKVIFHLPPSTDPIALCKKLFRLENKLNWASTNYSNGHSSDEEIEKVGEAVLKSVDKILHYKKQRVPVFFNRDPRGHALKIDDDWMRKHNADLHRDWGGYGIIAPDLRENTNPKRGKWARRFKKAAPYALKAAKLGYRLYKKYGNPEQKPCPICKLPMRMHKLGSKKMKCGNRQCPNFGNKKIKNPPYLFTPGVKRTSPLRVAAVVEKRDLAHREKIIKRYILRKIFYSVGLAYAYAARAAAYANKNPRMVKRA